MPGPDTPTGLEDQPAARGLSLLGEPLPYFAAPVRAPVGTTVPRRPHSIRRTMSIDVEWPEGMAGPGHYIGRCRDIETDEASAPARILSNATFDVTAASRSILSISATPTPARLQELVGVRAGGHLRNALLDIVPEEKDAGSPLYLLLDDLAGATLVSVWAFSQWKADWLETAGPMRKMEGICIGFRPGSGALDSRGFSIGVQNQSRVVPLPNPADPWGWHELPRLDDINFRRARRIDVWREGECIMVESHFQDSASTPDGGDRSAVHEYLVHARIGPDGLLQALDAEPGTLPHPDCRAAPANTGVLIGTPACALRETVLDKLKFTGGCTHLNDMLRSLAEVPVLARHLPFAA